MVTRAGRSPGSLFVVPALTGSLVAGCGDDGAVCAYEVCDVEEEACVRRVAEAVACHLDRDVIYPEVRYLTAEEYLAELEADAPPSTAEDERDYADYVRAQALLGLMPEDYELGDIDADAFKNFVALYSLDDKDIVMIRDRVAGDPQDDYTVMVHEMAHAYQDAAWDIASLYDEFAPTYDRQLGVRAFIEGDAVRVDDLAYVELERLELPLIDWDGYYSKWQMDMLEQAYETATPALDVTSLFPYAFGGEFTLDAWLDGGEDRVGDLAKQPPDSVRQVFHGYRAWPDDFTNGDESLDRRAVAVLPANYALLTGGHESVWAVNAMLQRTADGDLWAPEVAEIDAEYLSAWRRDDTEVVAMWRIHSASPEALVNTLARGAWMDAEQATPATHVVTRIDGDVLLIAVSDGDAHTVLADVMGWQSPEEAFPEPDAGGIRRGRGLARRLGCVGHAGLRPAVSSARDP